MPDVVSGRLVPATDIIVGRTVADEHVFILTDMKLLVKIDPFSQTAERVQLSGVTIEENIWGLARLASGAMWTLIGTRALGEISPEGDVVRRIPLIEPQVGLFGWNNRLVYQAFDAGAGTPALTYGPPGAKSREPFGSLRLRHFAAARVESVARNLVLCGVGRGNELPCWFRNEATIDRIRLDQPSSSLQLDTLIVSEPTPAATPAEERPRLIWDAYTTETNDLWILSTIVTALEPDLNAREARQLLHYSPEGDLIGEVLLPRPARAILAIREDTSYLLTREGQIAEVQVP